MPNPRPVGMADRPILAWDETANWQRIPILECGELLVVVPAGGSTNIIATADYASAGMPGALTTLYARSGVAERLLQAAIALKTLGATLVVFDAYRPLSVQKHLFETYAASIRTENPLLPDAEVDALVRRFVAFPSSDPLCPPPHRTGGAVDVYLVDALTGHSLPMGTEPDATEDASTTRYFEQNPTEPFRSNRRLLFHAMTAVGFTNYHEEWWHFDYGNQRWANVAVIPNALYGAPAEPS